MNLTHLSLFSGIGGLDLAAEWAGIETVGQCEWAEYPTKVLEKHWPDVPRWKDIRTLTGESFYGRTGRRTVDIISGGFPCQPFSVAGKQRGKEDDRYLWPEMVRVIKELRPTWIVGENVAGIVRMALPDILSELESIGYRTRTFLIPACAVGARHVRYRVAIVGYAESKYKRGLPVGEKTEKPGFGSNSKDVADTNGKWELQQAGYQQNIGNGIGFCCEDIQYSDSAGCEKQHVATESDEERFASWGCYEGNVCDATSEGLSNGSGKSVGGQGTQEPESERSMWRTVESVLGGMVDGFPAGMDGDLDFLINHYWDDEPDIPRIATGIKHRVDRLKCLGNAVVPQQFYPVFRAIAEIERGGIN